VSIRIDTDMLKISGSMRSVTADTMTVTEIVKSHVPVPNTLGPRDNFGRIRFAVWLTSTSLRGKRESSNVGGKRQGRMTMMVRPWARDVDPAEESKPQA
jgi:hypothetical protein